MDPDINRLAELSINGDSEAFGLLCVKTRGLVAKWVRDVIRDLADEDDAIQESFLRAWKNIHSLKDPQCFPLWMRSLTRNVTMNLAFYKKRPDLMKNMATLAVNSISPDVIAEEKETRDLVHQSLPSAKYYYHLEEYYFDKLSVKDIAAKHNIPVGTVKRRLFQARATIKPYLECLSKT